MYSLQYIDIPTTKTFTREYWMIYRCPGFLSFELLLPSRQYARPAAHRKTEKEKQILDEKGGGRGPQESQDLYKFNILCIYLIWSSRSSELEPPMDLRSKTEAPTLYIPSNLDLRKLNHSSSWPITHHF